MFLSVYKLSLLRVLKNVRFKFRDEVKITKNLNKLQSKTFNILIPLIPARNMSVKFYKKFPSHTFQFSFEKLFVQQWDYLKIILMVSNDDGKFSFPIPLKKISRWISSRMSHKRELWNVYLGALSQVHNYTLDCCLMFRWILSQTISSV